MIINEIFYSLQGEGRLVGVPSVFVRLAGCPLRCRWCDTKHALSESAGSEYSIEELKAEVLRHPTRHLVITGGEPLVADEFGEIVRPFAESGMHITIETSGIKFIPDLSCDLMSISPKLANSTPAEPQHAAEHEKHRFDIEALQRLIDSYDYQLKFVVDNPADLDEIAECIGQLKNINPYKIYLMPQAKTRQELIEKSQMLAKFCLQTGFSLSARLQVLLWEGEKGK
jgi:7-carboxy-7-deazaguanine synthase